jgi:hypothetical protein
MEGRRSGYKCGKRDVDHFAFEITLMLLRSLVLAPPLRFLWEGKATILSRQCTTFIAK